MTENTEVGIFKGGNAGSLPTTAPNVQALQRAAAMLPKSVDKPYLSLRKGTWQYGQEGAEIEPDSLWAINPHSLQHGLMEWFNGKPGGELLTSIDIQYDPNDLVLQFEDKKDDSNHNLGPLVAFDLACVHGDDAGLELHLKLSTVGGANAFSGLVTALLKQIGAEQAEGRSGPDMRCVPVVSLSSSHYVHKTYKRDCWNPVYNIAYWDDMHGNVTKAGVGGQQVVPTAQNDPAASSTVVQPTAETAPASAPVTPPADGLPAAARGADLPQAAPPAAAQPPAAAPPPPAAAPPPADAPATGMRMRRPPQ